MDSKELNERMEKDDKSSRENFGDKDEDLKEILIRLRQLEVKVKKLEKKIFWLS